MRTFFSFATSYHIAAPDSHQYSGRWPLTLFGLRHALLPKTSDSTNAAVPIALPGVEALALTSAAPSTSASTGVSADGGEMIA